MTITLEKQLNPVKPPKPWTKRNKSTFVNNAIVIIPIVFCASFEPWLKL